ncbi:hypothetical protein LSCM1_07919 [Leishmania martiniquensis]|uniref:Uncharacterized protein n=1 Tax=Leishmania martiniquensis TaxID=1580590 RepID=A0A836KTR5_9TRYP|nr:hypothetical protein LSCM1_07919 [Leishmania martiniquensis]
MSGALDISASGGAEAPPVCGLDAFTLQTIHGQQVIIFRQKELVRTLKERIEELEAQQRQTALKAHTPAREAKGSEGVRFRASEVQLRRRVETLEGESKKLSERVDELRAELNAVSAQRYAENLHYQEEKDMWRAKVSSAETKGAAATHLLEAMDKRNRKLFDQLEKLRREAEVTAYECAQWRSLATTAVSHLDQANQRYARDQMDSIEEDVRRYALNRLRPWQVVASASVPLDGEMAEETRKVWSRSAQLPEVHPTLHTFLPQKQEPVRSLIHVSHPPPFSQTLLSQWHPRMSLRPLPPPTSEHPKAKTLSSPPPSSLPRYKADGEKAVAPPAVASCRSHTSAADPPSTLKKRCMTPLPSGVED